MNTTDYIDITEVQTIVVSLTDDAERLSEDDSNFKLANNDSLISPSLQQFPIQSYHYVMLYFTLSVHVFVFLCGGFNNSLFCVTFIRYKRLQTPFNAMALALCINDFITSILGMPLSHALAQYQHRFHSLQTPLCNLNACVLNLCKWNAVLIMTEMAVIRARMVFATRLWLLKKRTVVMIITGNILVSGTFSVYRSYFTKINVCTDNSTPEKGHLLMNSGVFLGLFTGLIIGYVILVIVTHNRASAMSRRDRGSNRYEITTIRSCLIIVISYTAFHLPYIIYSCLVYYGVTDDQTYYTHSFFVSFFAFVNVADSVILLSTSSLYRKYINMSLYPVVK